MASGPGASSTGSIDRAWLWCMHGAGRHSYSFSVFQLSTFLYGPALITNSRSQLMPYLCKYYIISRAPATSCKMNHDARRRSRRDETDVCGATVPGARSSDTGRATAGSCVPPFK